MNQFESAVHETAAVLDRLGIPFILIGGVAVGAWNAPRATLDVDFSVWVEAGRLDHTVRALADSLPCRSNDPVRFVRQTSVLPLTSTDGVFLDVVFARLPYQRAMIQRGVTKIIAGREIAVASVEDLIYMKLISEREKDQTDAQLLIRGHRAIIDRRYLDPLIKEIAEALARPDILDTYLRQIGDVKR